MYLSQLANYVYIILALGCTVYVVCTFMLFVQSKTTWKCVSLYRQRKEMMC